MKVFGSISRLVSILFRKDGQDLTFRPNQATTYTAARDTQLPPGDTDHTLVSAASTQTLTNKTISGSSNTLSNISLTTSVTGTLPVANGGTNSSAALNNNRVIQSSGGAIVEAAAITASRALVSDSNGIPTHSSVTTTELGYVSGVTSSIQTQFSGKQSTSEKGQANGYASLDGSGKVPVSQLPNAIMEYQGTWNATTNSPTLADGAGSPGDVYRVSVAGSQNLGSGSITFDVGDYAIYNGSTWEKADTTDAVSSVFGRTGAVTATAGDYTATQITNTPAGNIAATTVQAALNELDSEKATTGLDNLTVSGLAAGSLLVGSSSSAVSNLAIGTNGYVLTSNGTTATWAAPTSSNYATNWTSGTSKTVTHNLGTRDVVVELYDNTTFEQIWVDTITRTDANTIDLTASEAASGSGWRVVVKA